MQDTRAAPLHTQVLTWAPTTDADADPAARVVPQIPTAGISGSMAVLHGGPGVPPSNAAAAAAAAAGAGGGAGAAAAAAGAGGGAQPAAGWQRGVIEKIVAVLYEYRVELAAAFSMFDTDRSCELFRVVLFCGGKRIMISSSI